jgi:hypothetical protein
MGEPPRPLVALPEIRVALDPAQDAAPVHAQAPRQDIARWEAYGNHEPWIFCCCLPWSTICSSIADIYQRVMVSELGAARFATESGFRSHPPAAPPSCERRQRTGA